MSTPEFTLAYQELLIETVVPVTGIAADKCAVADTDANQCDLLWLSKTAAGADVEAIIGGLSIGDTIRLQQADPDSYGLFVTLGATDYPPENYWEVRVAAAAAGAVPFTNGDPAEVFVENPAYVTPGPTPTPGGSSLREIVEAMAYTLEPLKTSIPDLQVYPYLNQNPTPPSIDMFPADMFQTLSGFGNDLETFWTVRARTTTADHEAGQQALLRMLDSRGPESVKAALEADQTLGGTAQAVAVPDEGVTGYQVYLEDPQSNSSLIGCEWKVMVIA